MAGSCSVVGVVLTPVSLVLLLARTSSLSSVCSWRVISVASLVIPVGS